MWEVALENSGIGRAVGADLAVICECLFCGTYERRGEEGVRKCALCLLAMHESCSAALASGTQDLAAPELPLQDLPGVFRPRALCKACRLWGSWILLPAEGEPGGDLESRPRSNSI